MPPLPLENALDKTNLPLREKLALFGESAIPLILPYGIKGSNQSGWNQISREKSLTPEYQANLYSPLPHNVAIRQGANLTQIAGFDFDCNDPVPIKAFFDANKWARENALFTIGNKGFTLWVEFIGPYLAHNKDPIWSNGRPAKIEQDGTMVKNPEYDHIEYRGNGYSVVHGRHPAGMDYRIFTAGTGLPRIKWGDLCCPNATFNWMKLFEGADPLKRFRRAISESALAARVGWVKENYEVIGIDPHQCKIQVVCPTQGLHSSDTGDGQTIIFTGADGTTPNFFCAHGHCKEPGGTNEIHSRIVRDEFTGLGSIRLAGTRADEEGRAELALKFKESGNVYRRGEEHPFELVHWRISDPFPLGLSLDTFPSVCAREDIPFTRMLKKARIETLPFERETRGMLAYSGYFELPLVKSYAYRPLLCKTSGGSAEILTRGFSKDLGIIVIGSKEQEEVLQMSFKEGLDLLETLLSHWNFKTSADRARALSELLTPALLQGGFIAKPIPIFFIVSEEKETGKTTWQDMVVDTYQQKAVVKAHGRGLTGGIEDMIRQAIKQGDTFCFLDEIKEHVISPLLNAIITGRGEADFRNAFERTTRASIEHLIVQMAAVRRDFTLEDQLSSRVIPIQIVKGEFRPGPDGSLFTDWLRANALRFLGAIYSVIIEWVNKGSPYASPNTRFPDWARVVNGILEMLGIEPCTDGLNNVQSTYANVNSHWLENFLHIAIDERLVWNGEGNATVLSDTNIRELMLSGGMTIPGNYAQNSAAAGQIQRSVIARAITCLPKYKESNDFIIRVLGDYFIHCYRCGSNKRGNAKYHYVIAATDFIAKNTTKYESDYDTAEL